MSAAELLTELGRVFDEHRWGELADLLHPDLRVTFVHTGETFDRDGYVRLNAEYPGFGRFTWEDLVDAGDRAVGRGVATGESAGLPELHAVAAFATARDGRITELTEVWTEVGVDTPDDRRPAPDAQT